MDAIWKAIDGKKTFITAALMGIAGVLLGLKYITQDQYNQFVTFAIPAALVFLRQAVDKK